MTLKAIAAAVALVSLTSLASATVAVQAQGGQYQVLNQGDIQPGDQVEVALTAEPGFTLPTAVSGDCPQGQFDGNLYRTGAIEQACSVIFAFEPLPARPAGQLTSQGVQLSLRVPAARLTVKEGGSSTETETALIGGLGLNYVGNFGASSLGYRLATTAHAGSWQDYAYVESELGADLRFLTHQRFRPYLGARAGKGFVLASNVDSVLGAVQEIPKAFSEQWTAAAQAGFTVSLAEQGFWSNSEFETFGRYALGQGSVPAGRELERLYEVGFAFNLGF